MAAARSASFPRISLAPLAIEEVAALIPEVAGARSLGEPVGQAGGRQVRQSFCLAGADLDKLSLVATYFGDPSLVNVQGARYRAVTAERVNAFARARLGADDRASLLYVPRETVDASASQELAEAGAR